MLIRQKPENIKDFISVNDSSINNDLQINGFMPMYFWDKVFYYKLSNELKKFIEERR